MVESAEEEEMEVVTEGKGEGEGIVKEVSLGTYLSASLNGFALACWRQTVVTVLLFALQHWQLAIYYDWSTY